MTVCYFIALILFAVQCYYFGLCIANNKNPITQYYGVVVWMSPVIYYLYMIDKIGV